MAKILIVEDSRSMATAEAYTLWGADHTVAFAASGEEALKAVEKEAFDLILLDYDLPDFNGLSVFRKIRAAKSQVPVIMITGKGSEKLAAQVIKEGARDYLVKSDHLLEILPRTVAQVLREVATERVLAQKEEALRRAHDTLEKRVADRTAELAFANERLQSEIGSRKRVEKALRDSNRQMVDILESISDGFFLLDDSLVLEYCNKAAERLLNRSKEEIVGRNLIAAFPEFSGTVFQERFEEAIGERKPLAFEVNFEVAPYRNWYDVRVFPKEGGITVHFQVTTERKRTEKRLEYLAHYDELTKLPNRTLFNERLGRAVERARRFRQLLAVMMIDLDRFKEINDTLGHRCGDRLLQEVAERFRLNVRNLDTVARLGGDEFAVVLPDVVQEEKASLVARRLLSCLEKPFRLEGHEVYVTASIGITLYPADTKDVDHMVKNADTAMYHAKDEGKNNFQFFSPAMNTSALEKFTIEADLRRALTRQEFLLHYQPKVAMKSGRIVGVEALVRWAHPERGLVSPATFIPIAEDTGLIVPLGAWVLKEACRQNMKWQEEGMGELSVSVNVSVRQFHKKTFPEEVARTLSETGIDPSLLEIEITESVLIQEVEETEKTLDRLKEMGLRLSIDDFGTGYSSLSYLKRFPLDVLKIDRSFVNDITTDPDDRAVVSSIIGLAHNLNLEVIAEGVETQEQFLFLKERDCDQLQGYYFSRPVGGKELSALVRDRKGRFF